MISPIPEFLSLFERDRIDVIKPTDTIMVALSTWIGIAVLPAGF